MFRISTLMAGDDSESFGLFLFSDIGGGISLMTIGHADINFFAFSFGSAGLLIFFEGTGNIVLDLYLFDVLFDEGSSLYNRTFLNLTKRMLVLSELLVIAIKHGINFLFHL